MRKIIPVLIICLIPLLSCSRKKLIFSGSLMSEVMLIKLDPSGYNESRYIFVSEYQALANLLNRRIRGKTGDVSDSSDDFEGNYILRFEYQGQYYILKLKGKNNFILNIKGKMRHFYVSEMRDELLKLDSHFPFDTPDVFSVRLFTNKLNRDSAVELSVMAKLFDALSKTKDQRRLKTIFSTPPDYIIRVQLTTGGYQLFATKDKVWINGDKAIYIYSSPKIEEALKAFAK